MILIDRASIPAHGRLWCHLASDSSYDELHAFAAMLGVPSRGFDRDHYDIPVERRAEFVSAGAVLVSSRELVARLRASGLRRRRRHVRETGPDQSGADHSGADHSGA